ncbi:ABC-2 type transporter [Beutenbergia cavernae DSM 12333]|uniref:Transport permease protein n=1 Tax=Beutenbergia cavernae (strain ATCC BAA-8 / DSM 12333 / CCUG 43141 / JCM 11478 / NBRC 16432 / NCIMB 13614 / HKI 0122) TaxID=471853 RepID=C5C1L2_BEUC1|nr:ABC transporter permease [Beutenbergia cavernae]ACQ79480.1 ABC-2 type transporter [Beutenbergia cavernae DSM 12333]
MTATHDRIRSVASANKLRTRPGAVWRNRSILTLLVKRDLTVRYANSLLGYVWSILDPLLMSAVYWFVFTKIFHRDVGVEPYIIFLLAALLPWTWFQNSVGDSSHALQHESRLVRSTSLPRELWALRIVMSKGVEFSFSIPVLIILILIFHPTLTVYAWLFPVAMLVQAVLLTGIALLLSPLTVLLRDIDPLVKIGMRFMFYVSPIIYGINDVNDMAAPQILKDVYIFNPMAGILSTYRAAFFTEEMHWDAFLISAVIAVVVLIVGQLTFSRLERSVLKEL